MSPVNLTLVQVPREILRAFFPRLEYDSGKHYIVDCTVAEDDMSIGGCWNLAGIQLIGRALSAHEILAAISVRTERLPSGLGILAVSAPLEQRGELAKLRLVDTLFQTLERMLAPQAIVTADGESRWFEDVVADLVMTAMHILGVATAMALLR